MWATKGLPKHEQFRAWADLASQAVYPVRLKRDGDPAAPFFGEIRTRTLGKVSFFQVRADGHQVLRQRAEVTETREEFYHIEQLTDAKWVRHSRGEALFEPGQVVVYRSDLFFEMAALGGMAFCSWVVPRKKLDVLLPAGLGPLFTIGSQSGVGALVAATTETLAREVDRLEPPVVEAVLDNFCHLLAIASGLVSAGELEGGREALRAAALERVKRYVERHLAEPDLTPERVASAVGLSLRQLHRVFEPTGTSFARHVLQRRLAAACAELASPANKGRTVADIAFAWGFDNLVTFYRTFHRAYGAAPGEIRPVCPLPASRRSGSVPESKA
jgi:AraC-like DNA-binding protein